MAILIHVLLGLCLGSFFHVIILRIKDGDELFTGRSMCDSCGYQLAWFDLVPLISYCLLRGRCRKCKAKIPPSHLYSEIIFAAGFGIIGCLTPHCSVLQLFIMYISVAGLGMAAVFDFSEGEIYTPLVSMASFCVLLLNLYVRIASRQYQAASVLILSCGLAVGIVVALALMDQERHMGYGDYYVLILLFLSAGMKGMLESVFFGSAAGIVTYALTRSKTRKIPFVPLLYYGYLITLII